MTPSEIKSRTTSFAVAVVRLSQRLPHSAEAAVIGRQLLRSGTAVAANYRAVCRSRSDADFIAKLGVAIEEADEAAFWLELLVTLNIAEGTAVAMLIDEAEQLTKIFVASRETVRRNARHRAAEKTRRPFRMPRRPIDYGRRR